MVVTLVALAIGLAVGAALGGRPAMARRVRWSGLVVPGTALALLAGHVGAAAGPAAQVIGLACLVALLLRNRAVAGAGIAAVGVAANALVIAVDRGMPVAPGALVSAGGAPPGLLSGVDYGLLHHAQRPGDALTWLDDRWPLALGHQVLSAGDLLLLVGVAIAGLDWLHPLGLKAPRLRGLGPRLAQRTSARRADRPRAGMAGGVPTDLPDGNEEGVPAALLDVAVEPVEDRPGDGLLLPASAGEAPAHAVEPCVTQLDHRTVAEISGEQVYRSRFEWHPEPEFPESFDHRGRHAEAVAEAAGADSSPATPCQVDLDPLAAQGRYRQQLDP